MFNLQNLLVKIMPEFKVKVELTCKTCYQKFYSTVPDEFHIQPDIPNVKPVTFTIEELRGDIEKEVKDTSGKVIGSVWGGSLSVLDGVQCHSKVTCKKF